MEQHPKPTRLVKLRNSGTEALINAADFDPSVHEELSPKEEKKADAARKATAKAAAEAPVAVPTGPSGQPAPHDGDWVEPGTSLTSAPAGAVAGDIPPANVAVKQSGETSANQEVVEEKARRAKDAREPVKPKSKAKAKATKGKEK